MNDTPTQVIAAIDGLPDDFTLDDITAHLTEVEVEALSAGDDPVITAAQPAPEAAPVPVVPAPQMQAPPDTSAAEAALATLDTKLDAIQSQYDDGEMTAADFRAQTRAIIAEQAAAQAQINAAQTVVQANTQQVHQTWFAAVDAYHAAHPYLAQPEHIDAWDAALRAVNSVPDYVKMPEARRLELAHNQYAAHFKAINGTDLPSAPGKPMAADPKLKPRTDPREEAPMTLADFSSAAGNDVDDGAFAAIDRMMSINPIKAEEMLNALPYAQKEAYFA